jgi:hypothetical protein
MTVLVDSGGRRATSAGDAMVIRKERASARFAAIPDASGSEVDHLSQPARAVDARERKVWQVEPVSLWRARAHAKKPIARTQETPRNWNTGNVRVSFR